MAEMIFCPACGINQWKQTDQHFYCISCGTEVMPLRRGFQYAESYQQERGHYDLNIRAAKVESFLTFLKDGEISLQTQDMILEVGFGGGAIIEYLSQKHPHVFGIETHDAAIKKLAQRNIPLQNLATQLSQFQNLQKPFDYLFYLDSFEHLLDPKQHLEEIESFVHQGTRAVVVLPRADSMSRRCLGSLWPHNVPDHWVFYSQKGLVMLWEKQGWRCVKTWRPRKKVSLDMFLRHMGCVRLAHWLQPLTQRFCVWIRLGEMGVVFEKK